MRIYDTVLLVVLFGSFVLSCLSLGKKEPSVQAAEQLPVTSTEVSSDG
jgi:hypothetical protein